MKASHKDAYPFVLLLAPFAAGILFAIKLPVIHEHIWPAWLCFTCVSLFISLNIFYRRLRVYKHAWLGSALAAVFLFTAGIMLTGHSIAINRADHFSKINATALVVRVITEPIHKNANIRFTAVVYQAVTNKGQSKVVSGNLSIMLSDKSRQAVNYGDVLIVPANYKDISPPLNPAEFNYRQYMSHKNIYHQFYLSPGGYIVARKNTGNTLVAYAQGLRKRLVDKFNANIHDKQAAAIASTLILGYNAELSNDVLQTYSRTGTIHVLSVSGAHVGLIYLVLALVFARFNSGTRSRIITTLVIIACIWGYALLTGFSPPVCRAGMMLSFILIGRCFARRINQLNILALSAFISLLVDPLLITDVGFQLSYIAVAGLIVIQPLIYQKFSFKNKLADKLWLVSSASIAAQLVTLPLSVWYFHQVPLYFLISNLIILIPSAVIMYAGILYLLMPQTWLVTKYLGFILEKMIIWINRTLSTIEHAPFSVIDKIWLTPVQFALAVMVATCLVYCLYKFNRVTLIVSVSIVTIFAATFIWQSTRLHKSSELVFFSLRSNTAIAARSGKRVTLITDLEQNSKAFQYSIKPYLDSCGVESLNLKSPNESHSTNHITPNKRSLDVLGYRILLLDNYQPNIDVDTYNFIYITNKIRLIDVNSLTANKAMWILRPDRFADQDSVNNLLNNNDIKYMINGSNKALQMPSKQ
ncbi:ComEC family competence protein [Mucilaginibacter roseus]|uniref:ComEC family competence protein n=1 Tax=Mucilaginibacter roseus TaxID=1528868 RepID=A0ABS8U0E8_9SPHI|nr:ComEC/Rec2 family competence protein [Mucilaginibacter roseus]MCD8739548.1 ComEC family competence protein [Mucilaginibacter roseus]